MLLQVIRKLANTAEWANHWLWLKRAEITWAVSYPQHTCPELIKLWWSYLSRGHQKGRKHDTTICTVIDLKPCWLIQLFQGSWGCAVNLMVVKHKAGMKKTFCFYPQLFFLFVGGSGDVEGTARSGRGGMGCQITCPSSGSPLSYVISFLFHLFYLFKKWGSLSTKDLNSTYRFAVKW